MLRMGRRHRCRRVVDKLGRTALHYNRYLAMPIGLTGVSARRRSALCRIHEVSAALSRQGGKPLSALAIEQRGPNA